MIIHRSPHAVSTRPICERTCSKEGSENGKTFATIYFQIDEIKSDLDWRRIVSPYDNLADTLPGILGSHELEDEKAPQSKYT